MGVQSLLLRFASLLTKLHWKGLDFHRFLVCCYAPHFTGILPIIKLILNEPAIMDVKVWIKRWRRHKRKFLRPFTCSVCDATMGSLPNQNVWILSCTVTPNVSVNASIKFICLLEMALQPIRSDVADASLSLDVNGLLHMWTDLYPRICIPNGLCCNRLDCDLPSFEDIVPPDEKRFYSSDSAFYPQTSSSVCNWIWFVFYGLSNCNGFVFWWN